MSKDIDEVCLTFGKYRGMTPCDVSIIDPHYIVWGLCVTYKVGQYTKEGHIMVYDSKSELLQGEQK